MSRPGSFGGRQSGRGKSNAIYTQGKNVEAFIARIETEVRRDLPKNVLKRNRDRNARDFKAREQLNQN